MTRTCSKLFLMLHRALERRAAFETLVVAALVLGAGCQTGSRDLPSASVLIEGGSYDEVKFAVVEVFEENGFERLYASRTVLTFDKAGSAMNNLLYGGWETESVGDRARLKINPVGSGAFRIDCDAFRVTDRGDRIMEQEKKLNARASGKYRKLLNDIQERLSARAAVRGD